MRLGLVLSGGGSRGAFQAGVAAALEDAGVVPTVLSGTSAGAVNAAGLAAGLDAERLIAWWTSVRDRDVMRLRHDFWRLLNPAGLLRRGNVAERVLHGTGWSWLLDPTPLRRTLLEAFGGERIAVQPGSELAVSAVELASGDLVRFVANRPPPPRDGPRYRQVELSVDHLLASAAIPLLFRPARVGDDLYWDGGLVANTPLAPALAYEPDTVIVVTTSTIERPASEPRTLGEGVSLLIETALGHSLRADLARAEAINRLADAGAAEPRLRRVAFLVIEPLGHDLGNALRFEPATARRLVALGRELGAAALAGWQRTGRLP